MGKSANLPSQRRNFQVGCTISFVQASRPLNHMHSSKQSCNTWGFVACHQLVMACYTGLSTVAPLMMSRLLCLVKTPITMSIKPWASVSLSRQGSLCHLASKTCTESWQLIVDALCQSMATSSRCTVLPTCLPCYYLILGVLAQASIMAT